MQSERYVTAADWLRRRCAQRCAAFALVALTSCDSAAPDEGADTPDAATLDAATPDAATGPLAWVIIEDRATFAEAPDGVGVCGASARCGDASVLAVEARADIGIRRSGTFVGPSALVDPGGRCLRPADPFWVGLGGRLYLRFPRDLRGCAVGVGVRSDGPYGIYVCRGDAVDTSCVGGGAVPLVEARGVVGVGVP